jgi:anti-anti-sigma regulatory factor
MQDPSDMPHVRFAVVGDRRNGIDRLSLFGTLDEGTIPLLETEVDDVAHAGGAIVLDLHHLEAVDATAVSTLEDLGYRSDDADRLLFLVNVPEPVRDRFERDGAGNLLGADVSEVLSFGDGDWEPISLPPLPGERTSVITLRIVEEAS